MNVIDTKAFPVIPPHIQLQFGYQVVELGHSYFSIQQLVSIEQPHQLAALMEGYLEGSLSSKFSQEYMLLAILGAIVFWQQSGQLNANDASIAQQLSNRLHQHLSSLARARGESNGLAPATPQPANIQSHYCQFEFADNWQIKVGKCSPNQRFGIWFSSPITWDVEPPLPYILQQLNACAQALLLAPLSQAQLKQALEQTLSDWLAQFGLQHPHVLQPYAEWEFEDLSLTQQALCEVYCQAQALLDSLA
ncbi:hypothetical protein SNR37_000616 [Agarivorans aestuarii]|uniref:Uncharacterized protein n=1 Tax=Agarivorans aestuarii TaxID=1563703 RepID=A0ABU7G7B3_9ALTE|nr:hypothetical protein [Agarivorans aestuarii]MEE1675291.1 hypothetical protein [Agarivorans aestuarii]